MMKTIPSIPDTTLLRKYGSAEWQWFWKLDDTLIIRSKRTGRKICFQKVTFRKDKTDE